MLKINTILLYRGIIGLYESGLLVVLVGCLMLPQPVVAYAELEIGDIIVTVGQYESPHLIVAHASCSRLIPIDGLLVLFFSHKVMPDGTT